MSASLPRVFGPYYLLARLGQGAAGAAYLAKPLDASRGVPSPVVIKCLHTKLANQDEFVRRFRHEAQIAVCVEGRHVATTFDVGAVGEELYIALEYVAGWTFSRVLSTSVLQGVAPPLDIACGLVVQAARGLDALHSAKDESGQRLDAVHRDVSPKNIMIGDDGIVRIIDLGLGKSKAQDWQTGTGRIMGSPGYMPPEQVRGEAVDKRADVYALGTVLHELLTGQRYIPIDSSVAMLMMAVEKPFLPPSSARAGISAALDDITASAMAADANKRTATAAALADSLEKHTDVAGPAALADWVKKLLPDEQNRRQQMVARLLLESPDLGEPEVVDTVVFVQRSGVASLDPAPSPGLDPTRITSDSAAPMSSVSPSSIFQVQPARRWPQFLIVAVALIMGFAGGAWVTGRAPEPLDAVIEVPVEPARPSVSRGPPRPVIAPAVVETPAVVDEPTRAEPPPAPPAPPVSPTKRRRRVVAEPVPPAPPPIVVPSVERLQRVEARLKRLDGSADSGQVTKLFARVQMVRAAKDSDRVRAQIDQIERDVSALESK